MKIPGLGQDYILLFHQLFSTKLKNFQFRCLSHRLAKNFERKKSKKKENSLITVILVAKQYIYLWIQKVLLIQFFARKVFEYYLVEKS